MKRVFLICAQDMKRLLTNALFWVLTGTLAVIVLVGAGVMLVASSGDEGRAMQGKQWLWHIVLGTVVVLLSLVAVRVVVGFLGGA